MTDLRHFLDIDRLDRTTLRSILDQAACFKRGTAGTDEPLKGKTIVLIFEKPSTRTRVSFEVGMMHKVTNAVWPGHQAMSGTCLSHAQIGAGTRHQAVDMARCPSPA